MNLIVDVGNTRIKLAIFEQSKLGHLFVTTKEEVVTVIQDFLSKFPKLKKVIISSVSNFPNEALQLLQSKLEVLELTKDTRVPFTNTYATPNTLGVDRIALVSAAAGQFPNKNVLIIDAGSCITYDFLTSENNYLGGGISPGLQMRYQALHTFTANLPLLSPTLPAKTIGDTTESSMHSGVFLGVANEINGFTGFYREKYPDFTIILTGGDAHLLRDSLKNSIFAIPNFLLEGLDHILEHNT
jgi:type III pantothenate kinase